jgi:hypothetical protein
MFINSWRQYIKMSFESATLCPKLVMNFDRTMKVTVTSMGKGEMKTYYQISAEGIGIVLLRKRKIAKALRRWLRENGLAYEYNIYIQ